MELFALLQVSDGSGTGIFETVSAINILLFGVFVAAVMASVMLFSMNKKFRHMSKDIRNIADLLEREAKKPIPSD